MESHAGKVGPVIVKLEELATLQGRVTMVDGGFDPIHAGHVEYFRGAAELGCPVVCSVSPDTWVARKHPPLLPQDERAAIIDAIRWIAYTHVATTSTEGVLRALRPRYYAKGDDWRGKLPDAELEACTELGIEIVYLDTVRNSSTRIMQQFLESTHETLETA